MRRVRWALVDESEGAGLPELCQNSWSGILIQTIVRMLS